MAYDPAETTEAMMILVSGATGKTGSELIEALAGQAIDVRALVRDPAKAESIKGPHVEPVVGDFNDAASLERVLAGAERAFLVSPPIENNHALEKTFVDAAKAAGVKHIVKLSAIGAAADAKPRFCNWHYQAERHLCDSGMNWTILRGNFFMQNLLGNAPQIKNGAIYMPAGEGKAAFIDVRDIAAVAEACLTEDGHEGQVYELTGPIAVSYAEIAALYARLLKRPVRYVDVPEDDARKGMIDSGMQPWQAEAINELNADLKAGKFAAVTDHVEEVGHKQPITLEQFLCDNLATFQ